MQNLEEVLSTIRSIGQMMENPAFQELMVLANQAQSPETQTMQQQGAQQPMRQPMGQPQEVDPMEQANMIGMLGDVRDVY